MPEDLPDLPQVAEQTVVTTPRQLQVLNSPMRMRILAACKEPRTVREMASRFDVPVTRLYYHVNQLEEAGFIEVVHVRKSGARLEKVYRVVGKVATVGDDLIGELVDPVVAARAMVSVAIEPMRADAESAVTARLKGGSEQYYLGRDQANLTGEDAEELISSLADFVRRYLVERHRGDDSDAKPYAFTYAFSRTDLI